MTYYTGSKDHVEDIRQGIRIDGIVRWRLEPDLVATIIDRAIDDEGRPWFTLRFPEGTRDDVEASRDEIEPAGTPLPPVP